MNSAHMNSDPATRAAYDSGPFAKILREAAADRERKRAEAALRPMSAAVFIDDDAAASSVEVQALQAARDSAADADMGAQAVEAIARQRLRARFAPLLQQYPAWLAAEMDDPALAATPRTLQPALPPPIGDGVPWSKPRKRRHPGKSPHARREVDYSAMRPFPGFAACPS